MSYRHHQRLQQRRDQHHHHQQQQQRHQESVQTRHEMKLTKSVLSTGKLGLKIRKFPYGSGGSQSPSSHNNNKNTSKVEGGGAGGSSSSTPCSNWFTVHDDMNKLEWSYAFYEHLHMELKEQTFDHLRSSMEGYAKQIFEDNFQQYLELQPKQPSWTSSLFIKPKTSEDVNWSPIIDAELVHIDCDGDFLGVDDDKDVGHHQRQDSTTLALVLVHRISYRAGEEVVVGRLLVPVKRGLCEIVIVAGDTATGWRESSIVAAKCREDPTITSNDLNVFAKTHDYDSEHYDRLFPSHCLSRIRYALSWLLHDCGLQVTEPSPYVNGNNDSLVHPSSPSVLSSLSPKSNIKSRGKHQEQYSTVRKGSVELPSLQCSVVPPPRFIHCPDPRNIHSDKQRFCRVSFGGTIGIEVLVVSRWKYFYTNPRNGGVDTLKQIAKDGATMIHESQQYADIQVDVEVFQKKYSSYSFGEEEEDENSYGSSSPRQLTSWFGVGGGRKKVRNQSGGTGSSNSSSSGSSSSVSSGEIRRRRRRGRHANCKVVFTWVECYNPKQETHYEHVIAWMIEPTTSTIFLIYWTDIMGLDHEQIRDELYDSLRTIRPSSLSSSSPSSCKE